MMREFSEFEKKVMKELALVGPKKPHVADIVNETILKGKKRVIQNDHQKSTILYYVDKNNVESALTELFDFFLLLKYLEENYLILIHEQIKDKAGVAGNTLLDDQSGDEMREIIEKASAGRSLGNYIIAPIKSDLAISLTRYFRSFVHPSSELRFLVENDFKTYGYIEARKQTKLARWTFCAAVATLFLSALTLFLSVVLQFH